jgi:hypothetical protein
MVLKLLYFAGPAARAHADLCVELRELGALDSLR